jgi:hypothetical protein
MTWHTIVMPKRNSRPLDVNEAAFEMVRRSTSELGKTDDDPDEVLIVATPKTKPSKSDISMVMAEMGRRGGQIGGKRRMETMSQTQRTKIAKKAAKARWGKKPS